MNLDELARAASLDLRSAAEHEVEPTEGLLGLRRLNTRHRVGTAVTAVVVLTALTVAVGLGIRQEPPPEPARPPVPRSALPEQEILVGHDHQGLSESGGELPHLPDLSPPYERGYRLAFSPHGDSLAYARDSIWVMDLRTGAKREIHTCDDTSVCPVAWSPDGRDVVTTSDGGLSLVDLSSAGVSTVALPGGWRPLSLDVNDAGRVLMVGTVAGQVAVMAVDLTGSNPVVVEHPKGLLPVDASWSPDGRTIAYLAREGYRFDKAVDTPLSVRVMAAGGSDGRTVATVGHCFCLGHNPGLAWSPGGRLVVASSVNPSTMVLYEVAMDGTLTTMGGGVEGPMAWYPGQAGGAATRAPAPRAPRAETLVVGSGVDLVTYDGTAISLPRQNEDGTDGGWLRDLAFSPDGSLAVFTRKGMIEVADPDTGQQVLSVPCAGSRCPVAWSADGRAILTSSLDAVYRIEVSSGARTLVAPLRNVVGLDVSAVGRLLLLTETNTDGRATMALTAFNGDGTQPVTVRRFEGRLVTFPQWSPDGRMIAYLRSKPSGSALGDWVVDVVKADGTGWRELATIARNCCGGVSTTLDWSPSGRIAASGKRTDGSATVYEVGLDGALTPHPGSNVAAWRPAG